MIVKCISKYFKFLDIIVSGIDLKFHFHSAMTFWSEEKINADVDKTDMAYILRQMQLGDMAAFSRMPNYADISEFPTNYQEVLQVMIDRERDFYAMPLEVREKFNNNFNQWLATMGTKEWFETMGITGEPKEPQASEEVKDGE